MDGYLRILNESEYTLGTKYNITQSNKISFLI